LDRQDRGEGRVRVTIHGVHGQKIRAANVLGIERQKLLDGFVWISRENSKMITDFILNPSIL
jgi:hypothetical protein